MENSKTIAAISTANGAGGIGVIRISGDKAIEIANSVFIGVNGKKLIDMNGYRAAFGHIFDDKTEIDEVIATVFRAPHSYTGENLVEFSCHGGLYITKRVLRTVISAGAAAAAAGEFTKRAFLNNKINLTQAEAVMDIIGAQNETAARYALACKDGYSSKKIENIKNNLVMEAAHLSAWADYPEDDIPQVNVENLLKTMKTSLNELNVMLKNYDVGKIIKEGIDTIIVGRPNVGKSTLMNLLSGCERSIVTEIPGTTRDIIEETVVLGDVTLLLSDTAGLRHTDNVVEKIGVEKAKKKIQSCGLILAVFDGSDKLTDDDRELIDSIKNMPCIAIINKTDKVSDINFEYVENNLKHVVMISAAMGTGIDELTKTVAQITQTDKFNPSDAALATERQRDCAIRGKAALEDAILALESGVTLDAVTVAIEDSIQCLLELTGERAGEVVVDNVFSHFCVGK